MIDKKVVKNIVEQWLEGKEYFLVDVDVTPDDKIVVEIDHADGVWIKDCEDLSRYIEANLNRDDEQYHNYIGKEVEVLTAEGRKLKGTLKSVEGRQFIVTVREKVKVEGRKRPVMQDVDHDLNMDTVKYTKYIISFK